MKLNFWKLAGLALGVTYFLRAMLTPSDWHLIDGVNLIFHEAGHTLFAWGPEWLGLAGGSIMQVLIPLTVAAAALIKRQGFTAGFALLWAGQSLVNVSVYAGDALKMQIPLISAYAEHDWNSLLFHFGALRHTAAVAAAIKTAGFLTLALGILVGIIDAIRPAAVVTIENITSDVDDKKTGDGSRVL